MNTTWAYFSDSLIRKENIIDTARGTEGVGSGCVSVVTLVVSALKGICFRASFNKLVN